MPLAAHVYAHGIITWIASVAHTIPVPSCLHNTVTSIRKICRGGSNKIRIKIRMVVNIQCIMESIDRLYRCVRRDGLIVTCTCIKMKIATSKNELPTLTIVFYELFTPRKSIDIHRNLGLFTYGT